MFLKHVKQALFRERFRQHIVHAMLEIHRDVVTSDVRCHSDDRSGVKLSNQMTSRNTVQVRHYNIHEYEVILGSSIHLIDCFQSIKLRKVSLEEQVLWVTQTYSAIDGAVESIKKFASNATARRVVFN